MLHVDIYLCIYCLTTLGSLSQRKVIEFRSLSNYYTEASEAMIMVLNGNFNIQYTIIVIKRKQKN